MRKPRVRILPYRMGSGSARGLSKATGILRIRGGATGRRYEGRPGFRPRPGDLIVNWGSHVYPNAEFNIRGTAPRFVNKPEAVYLARNKLLAFRKFREHDVPTVEWTTDIDVARKWDTHVVVRNTLTGQGGAGIVVVEGPNADDLPKAPLYTKYFKKKREFRLHIWRGTLLDLQEKKKRRDREVNQFIRSYNNGWVFTREGVACPQAVTDAAVKAVAALGLDFGAVDIGWNEHYQKAAVFEVNSAPGLEGTTLARYASKIKELR